MHVLLVDPAARSGIAQPYEHLGIAYLVSALREEGHTAGVRSGPLHHLSPRSMVREIVRIHPDMVGFSLKEVHARKTLRMIQELRHYGLRSHITLGGHFPTFHHLHILRDFPQVDSVIRGEGEHTLVELAGTMEKGGSLETIQGLTYREGRRIVENPPRPLIEDLDRLPFPARDLTRDIIEKGGAIGISASRGCYANCSFCSIHSFYDTAPGRAWRTRSPANVVDEIEILSHQFPRVPFTFVDDQFIGPGMKSRGYALDIVSEMRRRGLSIQFIVSSRTDAIEEDLFTSLKEAGLKKVFLGIEAGTQGGLNRFNKGTTIGQNIQALKILDKVGLAYTIAFIFFDPFSTMEEVKGNLLFLSEIRPYWQGQKGILSIEPSVTVHGGTPIERTLRSLGRLEGNYLGYTYHIQDRRIDILRRLFELCIRQLIPGFHELRMEGGSIRTRIMAFCGALTGKPQLFLHRFRSLWIPKSRKQPESSQERRWKI